MPGELLKFLSGHPASLGILGPYRKGCVPDLVGPYTFDAGPARAFGFTTGSLSPRMIR